MLPIWWLLEATSRAELSWLVKAGAMLSKEGGKGCELIRTLPASWAGPSVSGWWGSGPDAVAAVVAAAGHRRGPCQAGRWQAAESPSACPAGGEGGPGLKPGVPLQTAWEGVQPRCPAVPNSAICPSDPPGTDSGRCPRLPPVSSSTCSCQSAGQDHDIRTLLGRF